MSIGLSTAGPPFFLKNGPSRKLTAPNSTSNRPPANSTPLHYPYFAPRDKGWELGVGGWGLGKRSGAVGAIGVALDPVPGASLVGLAACAESPRLSPASFSVVLSASGARARDRGAGCLELGGAGEEVGSCRGDRGGVETCFSSFHPPPPSTLHPQFPLAVSARFVIFLHRGEERPGRNLCRRITIGLAQRRSTTLGGIDQDARIELREERSLR